jgi:hypothetical protein
MGAQIILGGERKATEIAELPQILRVQALLSNAAR